MIHNSGLVPLGLDILFDGVRILGHVSHVKAIGVVFEIVYSVVDTGSHFSDGCIHFFDRVFNKTRNSSIPKAQIFNVFPQSRNCWTCSGPKANHRPIYQRGSIKRGPSGVARDTIHSTMVFSVAAQELHM